MIGIKEILRRIYYLRSFLAFKSYGSNILLSKNGTIVRPQEISLGSDIFISERFHISARNLSIGSNVMIGPNLVIECDNHLFDQPGVTMFSTRAEREGGSVIIEDDVWIGANVTILPGSVISEGSIIGAASLVNKALPPYCICFGIPCKPYKPRFSSDELRNHLSLIKSKYDYNTIWKLWIENGLITR